MPIIQTSDGDHFSLERPTSFSLDQRAIKPNAFAASHAIEAARTNKINAKIFLIVATGKRLDNRAPSGAVAMLVHTMASNAGQ